MRTVVENNEILNKTHQLKNIGYIYRNKNTERSCFYDPGARQSVRFSGETIDINDTNLITYLVSKLL